MTLNQIVYAACNLVEYKDIPGLCGWEERNNPVLLARLREEQALIKAREIEALMAFVSGNK
jgi:hypothetical protein